jgi:hypothetical protein
MKTVPLSVLHDCWPNFLLFWSSLRSVAGLGPDHMGGPYGYQEYAALNGR